MIFFNCLKQLYKNCALEIFTFYGEAGKHSKNLKEQKPAFRTVILLDGDLINYAADTRAHPELSDIHFKKLKNLIRSVRRFRQMVNVLIGGIQLTGSISFGFLMWKGQSFWTSQIGLSICSLLASILAIFIRKLGQSAFKYYLSRQMVFK